MIADPDLDSYLNQLKKKTKKLLCDPQIDKSSSSSVNVSEVISSKIRNIPKSTTFFNKTDKLSILHQKYVSRSANAKNNLGSGFLSDSESITISSVITKSIKHTKRQTGRNEDIKFSSQSSSENNTSSKDPLNNLMTVDDLLKQYHESEADAINNSYHISIESEREASGNPSYNYCDESFCSEQESYVSEQIEENIQTESYGYYKQKPKIAETDLEVSESTSSTISASLHNNSLLENNRAITDSKSAIDTTLIERSVYKQDEDFSSDISNNCSNKSATLDNSMQQKSSSNDNYLLKHKLKKPNPVPKSSNEPKTNKEANSASTNLTDTQLPSENEKNKINKPDKTMKVTRQKQDKTMKVTSQKQDKKSHKRTKSSASPTTKSSRHQSLDVNSRQLDEKLKEALPRILPGILNNLMPTNSQAQVAFQSTALQPAASIRIDECLRQTVAITKQLLDSHMQMYDTYQQTLASSRQLANLKLTEEYIHNYRNGKREQVYFGEARRK